MEVWLSNHGDLVYLPEPGISDGLLVGAAFLLVFATLRWVVK